MIHFGEYEYKEDALKHSLPNNWNADIPEETHQRLSSSYDQTSRLESLDLNLDNTDLRFKNSDSQIVETFLPLPVNLSSLQFLENESSETTLQTNDGFAKGLSLGEDLINLSFTIQIPSEILGDSQNRNKNDSSFKKIETETNKYQVI